jgi:hypothetical protein
MTITDNPHIRVTEADGSQWVSAEAFDEVLMCLRWITDRNGECLADHPKVMARFEAVIAKAEKMERA